MSVEWLTARQSAARAGIPYETWSSKWLRTQATPRRPAPDGVDPETSRPRWKSTTVDRFIRQRAIAAKPALALHHKIVKAAPVGLAARKELGDKLGVSSQTIYRHLLKHAARECPCEQAA